jgi:hypothetical protein
MSAFDPERTLSAYATRSKSRRFWHGDAAAHAIILPIKKVRGRSAPHRLWSCQFGNYAFAACGSQMRIFRVSGIRKMPSTKHIAGTTIG